MGYELYSFSQAQGYEEIPEPFKLEELPKETRTRIWNLFFAHLEQSKSPATHMAYEPRIVYTPRIGDHWERVFRAVHAQMDHLPLDEWSPYLRSFCEAFRRRIEAQPFNKVFDLIQFVLRHADCPSQFVASMRRVFADSRLAYNLDPGPPPTIVPAATSDEGAAVVESLQTLRQAGLAGSATHLRNASARINEGDWAGSVRESTHAVESVARQLDPKAARTLGPALKSMEDRRALHPALRTAFDKLYGYTSDEQGIRHALLGQTDARGGRDEAVFMLGACASFARYLRRKHVAGESS